MTNDNPGFLFLFLFGPVPSSFESRLFRMIPIVVYGITIIAITLMFLLLYTPITVVSTIHIDQLYTSLQIFFVDREYRKSSAYIIMTHIAITDIAQLLIHCYTGVLVVLQTQPVYWVDKVTEFTDIITLLPIN